MARGAADVDAEPVGIGHARTGLAAHGAGIDLAPDVRGIGTVDAIEYARADHELGALAVFLAGLENDANLAVDVIGHVAQNLQRAEHHGDMAVVAAGVHAASLTLANSSPVCSVTGRASISARSRMRRRGVPSSW